jgi:hypothetical protein
VSGGGEGKRQGQQVRVEGWEAAGGSSAGGAAAGERVGMRVSGARGWREQVRTAGCMLWSVGEGEEDEG